MAHIVSKTEPPNGSIGDEWYNPTTNILYKLVAYNGTSVRWTALSSLGSSSSTTTTTTSGDTHPFLLSGM